MIKLAITGCCGRMGQYITQLALKDKDIQVVALVESPQRLNVPDEIGGVMVSKDISAIQGADILIDFSLPEPTMNNLSACLEHKVAMVIGTTGLTEENRERILAASEHIAIVQSTNMSIGVNVVFSLLKKTAALLNGYKVSITETHHIHKKDAPSGTAKTMAELIEEVTDETVEDIESLREGEVVGDHKVTFDSEVDTIEIFHRAKTRVMFAEGAITAAKFLAAQEKGFFTMEQVLDLES